MKATTTNPSTQPNHEINDIGDNISDEIDIVRRVSPAIAEMTKCDEGNLWQCSSTITDEDFEGDVPVDGTRGTAASAITYAASFVLVSDDSDTGAELVRLHDWCDAEAGTLEAAAWRLWKAEESGALWQSIGEDSFISRMVILDNVTVAEPWRGRGLGRHVAAHALYAAGAYSGETLVVATTGIRASEDSEHITKRTERLLGSLGLTRLPNDLWCGWCGRYKTGGAIEMLAQLQCSR